MTTIRLTLEPKREEQGDRVRIVGGKLDLAVFGPGSSQAPIDTPVAGKLVFHAAFLDKVRGATPEFKAFAEQSGQVRRINRSQARFAFEPGKSFEYTAETDARAKVGLEFSAPNFEAAPAPGSDAAFLKLPKIPEGARFLEIGVALHIGGAEEAALDANDVLDIPLGFRVRVVRVSPHFAPGTEVFENGDPTKPTSDQCRIEYVVSDALSMVTEGRIEVASRQQPDRVMAKVPLTPEQCVAGTHTVVWDGKCTEGAHAGKFLTALESPYVVKVVLDTATEPRTASAETAVRVAGIAFRRAPYSNPDAPPAAGSSKHYQLRLTEMGYHTGPIDGSIGDKSKRAIKDFQLYHPGLTPTGNLDAATKAVLDETPPGGSGLDRYQFILNAIGYSAGPIDGLNGDKTRRAVGRYRADKGLGPGDTLDDATKTSLDAQAIPPLKRREVLQGDHDGGAAIDTALPALGTEAKLFIYGDGSLCPGSLPYRQKFSTETKNLVRPHFALEARPLVLKSDDTPVFAPDAVGEMRVNFKVAILPPPADFGVPNVTARAYVQSKLTMDGGEATTGHHAHQSRGGVRTATDPGVFLKGAGLKPYDVKTDGPVYYSKCSVADDRYKGTAGVYFTPSTIAGDRFAIVAEIDAEGFDLPPVNVTSQTGIMTVWRRYNAAKLWFMSYVPNRPHRTESQAQLGLVPWYTPAFVEFKEPVAPTVKMIQPRGAAHEVIDLALFTALLRDAGYTPAQLSDAQIQTRFNANVLWPLQPAAVLNPTQEQRYYDAIDSEITAFEDRFATKLHELSLLETTEGLVTLVFDENAPRAGTMGLSPLTNPNLQTWAWSLLAATGTLHLIWDQDLTTPGAIDGETMAHEFGHALWLHHASTSAGSQPHPDDQSEHNPPEYQTCTMSYVSLADFCGKCVLKLRGLDETKV